MKQEKSREKYKKKLTNQKMKPKLLKIKKIRINNLRIIIIVEEFKLIPYREPLKECRSKVYV